MLKVMGKKIFKFYAEFFCLSKPMIKGYPYKHCQSQAYKRKGFLICPIY